MTDNDIIGLMTYEHKTNIIAFTMKWVILVLGNYFFEGGIDEIRANNKIAVAGNQLKNSRTTNQSRHCKTLNNQH